MTVDKSVTICRGVAADGQSSAVTVHEPGSSPCVTEDGAAPTPVLDASARGTTVLDITADDVTVKDLTLRWSVQPEDVAPVSQSSETLLPGINTHRSQAIAAQTQRGLVGVTVSSDGVTLEDNTIEMETGPCAVGISRCGSAVPAAGVYLTAESDDAVVRDNVVSVAVSSDEGTLAGDTGIIAAGEDYTVEDNTIRHWSSAGLLVPGEANPEDGRIEGNLFVANKQSDLHLRHLDQGEAPAVVGNTFHSRAPVSVHLDEVDGVTLEDNAIVRDNPGSTGILVEGGQDIRIEGNEIGPRREGSGQAGHAVTISADETGEAPQDVTLRRNFFRLSESGLNQYAIQVTPDAQGATVDARLNDWDIYTWGGVRSRVSNLGLGTQVLQSPFLTPS